MRTVPDPRAAAVAAGVRSAIAAILTDDDGQGAEARAAVVALIRRAVRDELAAAGLIPSGE